VPETNRDHVVADLADRFEMVFEAVERDEGWATNRVTPGKVILGNLDGIEAGVRQMIRKVPLEVAIVKLPSGSEVTVPTEEETLRIRRSLSCATIRPATTSTSPLSPIIWGWIEPPKRWHESTTTTPISTGRATESPPSSSANSPIRSRQIGRSSINFRPIVACAGAGAIGAP
jgi:hypothetical protein